ncbi:DUF3168 domain-containing protein [Diaphorobacter sp. HDW4B]|uniref:tail completion protein gp17 n=1 Tax=Diaphorobacter sp. HDW4B TaxID=2714925 RepID=UPI00140B4881|nr:DUF3168 domain-containing protein [Diaphorobacter sp. HDW4B]QIL69565.1 DUF3168 domain-containing protein [Diaphorobacter sp. HDW4B]
MSLETDLIVLLKTKCPRVHLNTAPYTTQTPYVIWERGGGQSVQFLEGSLGSKRNALVQITVWHDTGMDAYALLAQIEAALCASAALQVTPVSEVNDAFDDADARNGAMQTFSIWGNRS